MNYEEAYKGALEKAKKELGTCGSHDCDAARQIFRLFPELKESEDEITRKELLNFCKNKAEKYPNDPKYKNISAWIDWLEKQGEQEEPQVYETKDGEIITYSETDGYKVVEPKFKVGEWITDGYVGGQITSIEDNYPCYKIADFMGGINTSIPFTLQDNYHLWSIEDAKDGDVLAYVTDEEDLWIMIYWSLYEPYEGHVHYHALLVNDNFSDKGTCYISINNLKPATKEQRDLLFQKMHEAGYKWNEEKKELRKIDQKSYGQMEKCIHCQFNYTGYCNGTCILKNNEQKPAEWSEEDERIILSIEQVMNCASLLNIVPEKVDKIRTWLKSIKQRMEEQE